MPPVSSTTIAALSGPLLWPIVYSLYTALLLVADIYKHQGLLQEADFYMKQALETVQAVDAAPFIVHTLTVYGDLKIRSGAHEEGQTLLERADKLRKELLEQGKELVILDCSLGNMYRKIKSWDMEFDAYENAEKMLEDLISNNVGNNIKIDDIQSDLLQRYYYMLLHS